MLHRIQRTIALGLAMFLALGIPAQSAPAAGTLPGTPFYYAHVSPLQADDAPRPTVESIQMLDFAGTSKRAGVVYAYRKDSAFGHYYFLPNEFKLNQGAERDRINAPDGKSRLYVIAQGTREDETATKKHDRLMAAFREVGIDPSDGGGSSGYDQPSAERHIDYAVRLNNTKGGFRYRAALLNADLNGKQLIVVEKTPVDSEHIRQAFAEIERSISADIYDFKSIRVSTEIDHPYDGQYYSLPNNLTVYLPGMQFSAVTGIRTISFRYQPLLRRFFAADELPFLRIEEMTQRNEDDDTAHYAQKRVALVAQQLGFDPEFNWSTFTAQNDPDLVGNARTVWWTMKPNDANDAYFIVRIMYTLTETGGNYIIVMSAAPTPEASSAMSEKEFSEFIKSSYID